MQLSLSYRTDVLGQCGNSMQTVKSGHSRTQQKIQPNGSLGWGLYNCSPAAGGVNAEELLRSRMKSYQGVFVSAVWAMGSLGAARW